MGVWHCGTVVGAQQMSTRHLQQRKLPCIKARDSVSNKVMFLLVSFVSAAIAEQDGVGSQE